MNLSSYGRLSKLAVSLLISNLPVEARDLPRAYDLAMMRPPVDISSLSDADTAGEGTLRKNMQRLTVATLQIL